MTSREREAIARKAAVLREKLDREVAISHATSHEKAFIQQRIAHLWVFVSQLTGVVDQEDER